MVHISHLCLLLTPFIHIHHYHYGKVDDRKRILSRIRSTFWTGLCSESLSQPFVLNFLRGMMFELDRPNSKLLYVNGV